MESDTDRLENAELINFLESRVQLFGDQLRDMEFRLSQLENNISRTQNMVNLMHIAINHESHRYEPEIHCNTCTFCADTMTIIMDSIEIAKLWDHIRTNFVILKDLLSDIEAEETGEL